MNKARWEHYARFDTLDTDRDVAFVWVEEKKSESRLDNKARLFIDNS
jgi:hypothetical protein